MTGTSFTLPLCRYRVELSPSLPFYCRHASVRVRGNLVTGEVCANCTLRTVISSSPREIPGTLFQSPGDEVESLKSLPGNLAVLTCYFNPCGYESLRGNFLSFANGMRKQNVLLYTIELAFGDDPFFLSPGERVIQVRGTDVLWQKERMLNRLLEAVPAEFDKIAWVDADLIFTNPNWVPDASRLLREFPVVQLFEQAIQLTRDGAVGDMRNGVAVAVARKLKDAQHLGISHPGFAWAARRDLLTKHGLYDENVFGGGDSLMVYAMFGWLNNDSLKRHSPPIQETFAAWGRSFWEDVRGRVGIVPGRVLHMWHGSRANRKYVERVDWLRQFNFDPRVDITLDNNGLWRWTGTKPGMHEKLRQYFLSRREDD